ncbi:uncharacterized protein LOC9631577 [Selaginella moellendorffii]|nr:uncharacterized protein LOC9631577 [Selaginella moellendorffii]|eukprot:XP_002968622.2 uncharacterized protein LOC9631577 [Selaginella moellendorffii]
MAAALVPRPLLAPSPASSCQVQTLGCVSGACLSLRHHQSHLHQQWRMRAPRGPTPHWRIFRVFAESTEAAVDSDAPVAAPDDSQVEPETAKEEESGGAAQEEQTEAEKLVMMLKAEGSMPDVSIPIVQSSLEAMEDVSDVRITTFEGLTSISLTKKTIIQATNVASEIVDTMEKAGFRMHTLNLAIDDED